MRILIRDARLEDRPVDVLVDQGLIHALGDSLAKDGADRIIEAAGATLAPAFVDLQVNGAFGHDLATEPESLWTIAAGLPAHGVGAFLPTLITSTPDRLDALLAVLREGPPAGHRGARVLGLHLEGPHLAPSRRGAHEAAHLRSAGEPHPQFFAPEVRLVTLAPELPGALELISMLRERGIVVSGGHSEASYAEAQTARLAGMSAGTHLFNAMSGLHHREPGLAAALLDDDDLACGIIADGVHVADALLRLAWKLKGPERLFLVSDAMAAAGCTPGLHELAGQQVRLDDDAVRLPDGTLAGSSAFLDRCLRHFMKATGEPLEKILPTVTTTPARLIGFEHELAIGAAANLILLDEHADVCVTILDGAILQRA